MQPFGLSTLAGASEERVVEKSESSASVRVEERTKVIAYPTLSVISPISYGCLHCLLCFALLRTPPVCESLRERPSVISLVDFH